MQAEVQSDTPIADIAYGCVFCLTGTEVSVAETIRSRYPQIRATAVRQIKRHTHKGVTSLQADVVLPGYVLLEAAGDAPVYTVLQTLDTLSILTYSDGDWRLYGEDEIYAKWVFRYNGVIRLSNAYQIGNRVHIIDGPLKDLEGKITRIDRKNRNGQVTLQFGGNTIKVWLGFDIVAETRAIENAPGRKQA